MDIEPYIQWLRELPDWGIYAFIAFASAFENLFPPWPGDAFVVFAGFLAAREVISLSLAFFASLAGNVISSLILYFAGVQVLAFARRLEASLSGPAFFKQWLAEFTSESQMEKTGLWFQRFGFWLVLVSRFLAGIRVFVVIVAGVSRMNFAIFLLSFSIGVCVWNTLLLAGGYALGENWELVLEWIRIYSVTILSVMTVAIVVYFWLRWRKASASDEPTDDGGP